jgi:hypothetical protein
MDIRRDLCYGQKKAATGGNPTTTTEVSIQAWRDINIPKQIQFQMSICHGRPLINNLYLVNLLMLLISLI